MSDQTITSLIEQLEGASEGSVELDALIYSHLSCTLIPRRADYRPRRRWPDGSVTLQRKVTTSLDAALALAERVLPGWWWTAGRCGLTCHASVGPDSKFIGEPDLSKFDSGFHADVPNPSTPAIALCIAILRAQSEAR